LEGDDVYPSNKFSIKEETLRQILQGEVVKDLMETEQGVTLFGFQKEMGGVKNDIYSYAEFMKALGELENQLKAMKHNVKGTSSTTKSGRESLRITKQKLDQRIERVENMKKNKETYQQRSEKRDNKRGKKHPDQDIVSSAQEVSDIDIANYLEIFNAFDALKRDIAYSQASKPFNNANFSPNPQKPAKPTPQSAEQRRYHGAGGAEKARTYHPPVDYRNAEWSEVYNN
jgi:hypothetical protein